MAAYIDQNKFFLKNNSKKSVKKRSVAIHEALLTQKSLSNQASSFLFLIYYVTNMNTSEICMGKWGKTPISHGFLLKDWILPTNLQQAMENVNLIQRKLNIFYLYIFYFIVFHP